MAETSSSTIATGAVEIVDLVSLEEDFASNFRSKKQLTVAKIIATTMHNSYKSCFPPVFQLYQKLITELTSYET